MLRFQPYQNTRRFFKRCGMKYSFTSKNSKHGSTTKEPYLSYRTSTSVNSKNDHCVFSRTHFYEYNPDIRGKFISYIT